MRWFQDEKLKEDADAVEIAQALNMNMVRRGRNIFIECMDHMKNTGKKDLKLNKCIVTRRGTYCFSCGAYHDVIYMVRNYLDCSPYEARRVIAGLLGNVEYYLEDGEHDPAKIMPYNKTQLEALGLLQTVRVYLPKCYCEDEKEAGEQKLVPFPNEKYEYPMLDGEPTGRPMVTGCSRMACTLNDLFCNSPEEFNFLIQGKAQEMYWKWKEALDTNIAGKYLCPELAYHVNARYKNWMGICERIYRSLQMTDAS